jgi:hypothetical protein
VFKSELRLKKTGCMYSTKTKFRHKLKFILICLKEANKLAQDSEKKSAENDMGLPD